MRLRVVENCVWLKRKFSYIVPTVSIKTHCRFQCRKKNQKSRNSRSFLVVGFSDRDEISSIDSPRIELSSVRLFVRFLLLPQTSFKKVEKDSFQICLSLYATFGSILLKNILFMVKCNRILMQEH